MNAMEGRKRHWNYVFSHLVSLLECKFNDFLFVVFPSSSKEYNFFYRITSAEA